MKHAQIPHWFNLTLEGNNWLFQCQQVNFSVFRIFHLSLPCDRRAFCWPSTISFMQMLFFASEWCFTTNQIGKDLLLLLLFLYHQYTRPNRNAASYVYYQLEYCKIIVVVVDVGRAYISPPSPSTRSAPSFISGFLCCCSYTRGGVNNKRSSSSRQVHFNNVDEQFRWS